MDFERKDNFSYLDGVPLKIGSRFCPPREIPLPLAFHHQLPTDILTEEYNFSLEKKVLEMERQRKMEEEVAKDVKVGSEIENFSKAQELGNGTASIPTGGSIAPSNQNSTIWPSNLILQPKPRVMGNFLESAPTTGLNSSKIFNLSDFENDSSSPFDYMELQTINDLEELSTVFQGLNDNSKTALESNKGNDGSHYFVPPSSSVVINSMQETVQQSGGSFSKSVSFPLPQHVDLTSYKLDSDSDNRAKSGFGSMATSEWSISKNTDNHLSNSYPSVSGLMNDFSKFLCSDVKRKPNNILNDSSNNSYPALSQVPCITSNTGRNSSSFESKEIRFPAYKIGSVLRSSKSVSDLRDLSQNDAEATSQPDRSHTPPAKVSSYQQYASHAEKTFVKHLQCETLPKDILSSNGLLTCNTSCADFHPDLPDPYYELSSAEKQVVDSITEMGFNRSSVARTVKHTGTDEKQVVDHLCQIQVLEESGYDPAEAEAALHFHDYDNNEAIRFLDLLNLFQDLGFEKDAIKKALVQNKNDRDKVMDALLP